MALMVIMITLITIMAMDITDLPIIMKIMEVGNRQILVFVDLECGVRSTLFTGVMHKKVGRHKSAKGIGQRA